jgi:integrase
MTQQRKASRNAGIRRIVRGKGVRYEARYYDPQGKERGKTFKTEAEAKDFRLAQQQDVQSNTYVSPEKRRQTWQAISERYLASLHEPKVKARTVAGYEAILKRWFAPWDDKGIGMLGSEDVEELLTRLSGKGIQTQHNVFNVGQAVFAYAVKHHYRPDNPAREMRDQLPSRAKCTHEPRFLTAGEVNALAAEMPAPYDDLVRFGAWSGLRLGEMLALRVRHVDPIKGTVKVEASYDEVHGLSTPKSAKSRRTVPIAPALARQVVEAATLRGLGPDGYLFGTADAPLRRSAFYRRVWQPGCRRAGLADLRVHDLRHTYAGLMAAQGRPIHQVSRWMGHDSASFTMDFYMRQHGLWTEDGEVSAALDAGYAAGLAAVQPTGTVTAISAKG